MEIKWLEDFLSLVDTRNFSRSAEIRNTTQPAFSRRIKSLEGWVGTTLFDRSTQPIGLTQAGNHFRPYVEEVLRRLYQGREEVRNTDKVEASTITFAATHSLSLTFFPAWIRSIEYRTGVLSTRLDSGQAEHCTNTLLRGDCHFMLCHTHASVDLGLPANHFSSTSVGEDVLLPVISSKLANNKHNILPGTAKNPIDYLAYAETSAIGRAVENMLAKAVKPAHLNKVFVSQLAGVLKSMSCDGRGLSWLPKSQIKEELKKGDLVIAGDDSWALPVEIRLFRSRDTLPQKSEEFWSLFVDASDALAQA